MDFKEIEFHVSTKSINEITVHIFDYQIGTFTVKKQPNSTTSCVMVVQEALKLVNFKFCLNFSNTYEYDIYYPIHMYLKNLGKI